MTLVRRALRNAFAIGAVVVASACVPPSQPARHPDLALLDRSWSAYKARFITEDGRVVRRDQDGDTVSEGQAYAMLRAAWMDDRATFDRVWAWTRAHLGREGRPWPALMAWRWALEPDRGGYVSDWSVAPDADTDIALSLLLAADAWPGSAGRARAHYLEEARAILRDLIELTAVDESGARVLLAGEWADHRSDGRGLVLNPSYFAPAAYRHFARVTGDGRWLELVRGSYLVLTTLCHATRDSLSSGDWRRRVPPIPDWVRWESATSWTAEGGGTPGWDAVRIPWRIGTDRAWFAAVEADQFVEDCLVSSAKTIYSVDRRAGGSSFCLRSFQIVR